MKKLFMLMVVVATFSTLSFGQVPESFNYQAIVRNASNVVISNQSVGMRMTIKQGSANGLEVYSETFSASTNAHGLVNVAIGNGTALTGNFSNIDWSNGPYFIETAVDAAGGSNYDVMGTSQLMSVPYALYAKTSGGGSFVTTPSDPNSISNVNYGNVGIGTNAPTQKLEVEGNVKVNGTLNNMNVGNMGTGSGNVVLGNATMSGASSSDDNTVVGNSAMNANTIGNNNVAVGAYAMSASTTGHSNAAIGMAALVNNTSGIQNNAVGWLALQSNTTGDRNTAIGNQSDVASGNLTNATAIGNFAVVDASNKIQLGSPEVTSVNTSGVYTGAGFKTPAGTSSQYLMADGSVGTGPQGPAGPSSGNIVSTAYSVSYVGSLSTVTAYAFLGSVATVTITAGQKVEVTATATLGTTMVGGATMDRLAIGQKLSTATVPSDNVSDWVENTQVGQNMRLPFTLNTIFTDLDAGTYQFGMIYLGAGANWNNNDNSRITVKVINP